MAPCQGRPSQDFIMPDQQWIHGCGGAIKWAVDPRFHLSVNAGEAVLKKMDDSPKGHNELWYVPGWERGWVLSASAQRMLLHTLVILALVLLLLQAFCLLRTFFVYINLFFAALWNGPTGICATTIATAQRCVSRTRELFRRISEAKNAEIAAGEKMLEEKKAELEHDISKLTAKLDQSISKSASLKSEVQELQSELAALTKQQAEMDKIRQEQHADYTQAKSDLEAGLSGVRKALGVLREYYGSAAAAAMLQSSSNLDEAMKQPTMPESHEKATGAGTSIIGILEVVESDFAKSLAAEETTEDDAADEYEKISQENRVTKTLKEQDVKYKTAEAKSLDKAISELTSDRATADAELSAVLDYFSKIKERCIAKPETYAQRSARREAEIAGLKEALTILEDETAFMQRGKRGVHSHFLGLH